MLRDLNLTHVYDSEDFDIVRELQVPLLKNSTYYLRGVGFFSSGWLQIASSGIKDFVENGGKAHFIMSPVLSAQDWEAFQLGEEAKFDEALRLLLASKIDDLRISLEKNTLNVLAWLIADDLLEIRFAIPRRLNGLGNYHNKIGVFTDENNDSVAVHGSLNDSIQGSLNGESYSVFKSWIEGQIPYYQKHDSLLVNLWNNGNRQFKVREIPDAIKEKIIDLRVMTERPYKLPGLSKGGILYSKPHLSITLHNFQEKAIRLWKKAGYRGVLEMATGTGKTYTSIAAGVEVYKEKGKIALIILVPYRHLLEQWGKNCLDFGFSPILCSGDHGKWQIKVKSKIQDFNVKAINNICIIALQQTAATERFHEAISLLPPDYTMIIGDEVHYLGARHLQKALTDRANMRMGLSATPRRWYDEEGTNIIFSYFGNTCYEYTLEEAIGTYLCPYKYFPQLIKLTGEEMERFGELTNKIRQMYHLAKDNEDSKQRLENLLRKRANILSSAENKIPEVLSLIRSLIKENAENQEEIRDVLIYCAPGKHKEVLRNVANLGLNCHEFVAEVNTDNRERILKQFAEGNIQVLVAIRCLDEGVDVPSTCTAFILSSSTNPRQFVQRRGRILRTFKGKKYANIYDFIVVPDLDAQYADTEIQQIILKREMPRFAEFASSALNEFEARSIIRGILKSFDLLHLMDEKPWHIYQKLKEGDRDIDE